MKHDHDLQECKKHDLKFCPQCDAVECTKCGKEWVGPCKLAHAADPYSQLQKFNYDPKVVYCGHDNLADHLKHGPTCGLGASC